jgi:hypothetical protein
MPERAKAPGRGCCGASDRRTTAAAELFASFIRESAGRTDESEREPALSQKRRPSRFSAWQRGHRMAGPPRELGRGRSDRCAERTPPRERGQGHRVSLHLSCPWLPLVPLPQIALAPDVAGMQRCVFPGVCAHATVEVPTGHPSIAIMSTAQPIHPVLADERLGHPSSLQRHRARVRELDRTRSAVAS